MHTSYGAARLTVDATTAGQVRVTTIHSLPALQPRLLFRLAWHLNHLPKRGKERPKALPFIVLGAEGELRLGEHGPAVGTLFQLGERNPLRSQDYTDEQQMELIIDLDWFRLERIEHMRQGGSLDLWLKIWPRMEGASGTLNGKLEPLRLVVPKEDWLAAVAGLSGDRVELLEVRYQMTYAGRFAPSLAELRSARLAVDKGDYLGALIMARKALLLLEEGLSGPNAQSVEQLISPKTDPKHAKTYATILARVKDLGNIQAHVPGAREPSRVEALFAIRLAENLLELVGALSP